MFMLFLIFQGGGGGGGVGGGFHPRLTPSHQTPLRIPIYFTVLYQTENKSVLWGRSSVSSLGADSDRWTSSLNHCRSAGTGGQADISLSVTRRGNAAKIWFESLEEKWLRSIWADLRL